MILTLAKLKPLFFCHLLIFLIFSCEEKGQPNILFIAVDDLRPELNFYGADHIRSPNLNQLASQSFVFNRAYCNIPVCGASRASLLTGARPTRNRFIDYNTWKDEDFPEAISLPMWLKQHGYHTISNGKIYHNQYDDSLAWDENWRPDELWDYALPESQKIRKMTKRGLPFESADVPDSVYRDGKLALKVIKDLQRLKDSQKPFFLTMGVSKPHLPFTAPQKYWDLYNRDSISLPENYQQPKSTPPEAFHRFGELRNYELIPGQGHLPEQLAKELIHGYYACVSYIDAQIGLVLEELERLGLADNTMIVLWGDHGWNLGNHMLWCKHVTFEKALRTPLIIKMPGHSKGQRISEITEFIDVYPTICNIVGIGVPNSVQGRSALAASSSEADKKGWAVSKFKDAVTLIDGNLFYTEWINDDGEAYARMLFDHNTDSLELDNLAEKPEFAEQVKGLSISLREKWGNNFLGKN